MKLSSPFYEVLKKFQEVTGLQSLKHDLSTTGGRPVLIIYVTNPTDRMYSLLELARESAAQGDEPPLATLKRKKPENLIESSEGKLLLKVLSEIQNVNRYSFQEDFWLRYTRSVSGAETQITALANHVVMGRRGAGKSMLLLYAWHNRADAGKISAWVDMQVYSTRSDLRVISDVLSDFVEQVQQFSANLENIREILASLRKPGITEQEIRLLLPAIRRIIGSIVSKHGEVFLFLDDFHVVSIELQPILLDVIYAIARGNRAYLKISAIETLTKTYDPSRSVGLEIPQDAQFVRLDYNLTMPDKALSHIQAILDGHAIYAGLKSIKQLCTSGNVIPRLTWVAAGVPRDAISLFAQAMTKASVDGKTRVSVSNVNMAASETLTAKLRDLETDASANAEQLKILLDRVRDFCVTEKRTNAFLAEIGSTNVNYDNLRKLVQLRLLHVINEGITIGEAGRKYLALILDYGFYTGVRAAQSVDLFNRQSQRVPYKEMRSLPVFRA